MNPLSDPLAKRDAFAGFDGLVDPLSPILTDQRPIITGAAAYLRGTVLGQVSATGAYKICSKTAADGSEIPVAVLADDADASAGDVSGAVYLGGRFDGERLIVDPSWTVAELVDRMRPLGIVINLPGPSALA